MRLIYATYNPGKMDEVKSLGAKYSIDVVSLKEVGVEINVEETGLTFAQNAQQKLKAAQAALSHNQTDWIVADDSGIMIDALGGEPGVNSRRWIGREMTDEEIISYTLQRLGSTPPAQRTAHFKCVLAVAKVNQNPLMFEAELEGSILIAKDESVLPQPGLPYRQLFFVSDLAKTLGAIDSLSAEQLGDFKTHRQRAFEKVFHYINDLQSLSGQFE
jgi:XTP/dITP diphosphohydrolase